MSYIDQKQEEEKNKKAKKLTSSIKSIISEDTIVENPQDIIDKDQDVERRNAFKKAYEILALIFPEATRKKKKRKKEEFDKDIQYILQKQNDIQRKEQAQELENKEKDKGMERGD